VERAPVLAWFEGGREVWVDGEGVAFPPRGEAGELVAVEGTPPSMPPVLESEQKPAFAPPALVSAVLKMAERVPSDTPIAYDEQYGLGWRDYRGWQVYYGTDLDQIEMKLQVYEAMVDNLERQGIQPELISLEFLHAPYYRLER
jgi:cell division protein FtsQ